MSELTRAVEAETAAYAPATVPAFETVIARRRARDRRLQGAAGAALAAVAVAGAVAAPSVLDTSEQRLLPPALSDPSPPRAADRLVVCLTPFTGVALAGRADCAVTDEAAALSAVRDGLAASERIAAPTATCDIAAASWELVLLAGDAVTQRFSVPDATCLAASSPQDPNGTARTVPQRLLDALRTTYRTEVGGGGGLDGLADPRPVAASCARVYPRDLPDQPVAFDGVVLGIANTDPADSPGSPRVPFSDLDVLVLDALAGDPEQRLVVQLLGPPPAGVVGERLLAATSTERPQLAACGFTQPWSQATAQQWADAFR